VESIFGCLKFDWNDDPIESCLFFNNLSSVNIFHGNNVCYFLASQPLNKSGSRRHDASHSYHGEELKSSAWLNVVCYFLQ
jgi:hypothetical protein